MSRFIRKQNVHDFATIYDEWLQSDGHWKRTAINAEHVGRYGRVGRMRF